MAVTDPPDSDDLLEPPEGGSNDGADAQQDVGEVEMPEQSQKMDLDVVIDGRGACQRHITVTVPRTEIARYYDKEFSELMDSAQVPGFREGRAPRKLVEARFHKDVTDRVKGALMTDSMAQINEDKDLSPISEPDIDVSAVELLDEGPMTFEFDLEVRPEFDLPQWKGLAIERPVRDFTERDVEAELQNLLGRYGRLVPHDGPASAGDYITANLTFTHDGVEISAASEEVIRIRPVLSFRDGRIDQFDKLMEGVSAGQIRQGEAELSQDAPNVALRGKSVTAEFEVLEVKKLELPKLTPEFLDEIGGMESEAQLRDAVKDNLQRQLEYHQRQRAREQVTAALTVAADWDLPPALLERQSRRELERAVLELQRSGFGEDEIRAHQNELRQNSRASTARALKEHFILERIAEDEEVDVEEADYREEIKLIAAQSGESPRRVRARLEKGGVMDALHNQIVERKVVDLILAEAVFTETPYKPEATDAEAIDQVAGGEQEPDIPQAKFDDPGEKPEGYP